MYFDVLLSHLIQQLCSYVFIQYHKLSLSSLNKLLPKQTISHIYLTKKITMCIWVALGLWTEGRSLKSLSSLFVVITRLQGSSSETVLSSRFSCGANLSHRSRAVDLTSTVNAPQMLNNLINKEFLRPVSFISGSVLFFQGILPNSFAETTGQ